jgi:hypothetical protein
MYSGQVGKLRFLSEDSPDFRPEVLPAALQAIHRGEAMGFVVDEDQDFQVSQGELEAFLGELRRERIGLSHVSLVGSILARDAAAADIEKLRTAFEGIFRALGENPVPHREWKPLLRLFGPQRLAALLSVSESSIGRYSRGERTTPDDVAGRLHWLAIVVGYLSGSYNDFGLRRWFERPRRALGGKSPQDVLLAEQQWSPEGKFAAAIEELARGSGGMTAT